MNLYHYTSGQGLEGIIKSSSLHCTNIMFLNDPSEHSFFSTILDGVIKTDKSLALIHRDLYNTSYRENIIQPSELYVGSFSKNGDSLAMWNHYAKGNGYNLELDIDSIIKDAHAASNNIAVRRLEVVYSSREQLEIVERFFREWRTGYSTFKTWEAKVAGGNDDYDLEQEAYYHTSGIEADYTEGIEELSVRLKHSAYEHEDEVRLIIDKNPGVNFPRTFRLSENGVFVEYFPLALNLKKHLKSITIHPLGGSLHLDGLERFLDTAIGYRKVPVRRSTIPFRLV